MPFPLVPPACKFLRVANAGAQPAAGHYMYYSREKDYMYVSTDFLDSSAAEVEVSSHLLFLCYAKNSLSCFRPFPEITLLERRRRRGAVLSSKKGGEKKEKKSRFLRTVLQPAWGTLSPSDEVQKSRPH